MTPQQHFYAAGVLTGRRELWAYGVGLSLRAAVYHAVARSAHTFLRPYGGVCEMYVAEVSDSWYRDFEAFVIDRDYVGAFWVHPRHLRSRIRCLKPADLAQVLGI